jgi:uncharacterized membrane protein YphA (DoxX/SURF4 family)
MAQAAIAVAPRHPRWLRPALIAGRIILAAIFLYAAYAKLREPWMLFAMSINSYKFLPQSMLEISARVLPWVELLLGIFLVVGWKLRWVASVAFALLLTFLIAMIRAKFMNLSIDCGCFGVGDEPLTAGRFVEEGMFLALASFVAVGDFVRRRV